jgi:two-component system phosphate regulon sensor histidine kinase PhoR
MRFKWKLFFTYLLIILIPFLAAQRYISHHLEERLLKQTEERLFKEALLVKTIIEKNASHRLPPSEMNGLVKALGKDIGERITYIDRKGSVLGDTEIPSEALKDVEGHSNRPEFIAAFRGSHGMAIRHSATLDMDMMYLAVKVEQEGMFVGVVRVALPLTEIQKLAQKTEYTLITAFVLCALFVLLLNGLVSKKLSKPVEEITRAAEAISEGNYDVKVYPSAKGELQALGQSVNTMASEIKKRVHEITQEKETLTTILRDMSDGVMVVDAQGRILLINSVLDRLLAHQTDVFGKTPVEVIRNAQLQDGFDVILQDGGTFQMELSVATADPEKIFDVTAAALIPVEKTEGAVAVFHDITELKRIDRVRKDFVANVSHELRTPLTSVKGYAETLSEGEIKDPSKVRLFAQIILKHANRLSTLVEDLLSLTRLEYEKSVPDKRNINFGEVLDASILVVRPAAEAKRLSFNREAVPEDLKIWADRDQISQTLINLLDNAVKYTPKGGTVSVSVTEVAREVHITVKDTGLGIPRKDLDRVFERFYRVDKNRSKEMGGTGLGLSIVKHIIQGHGGRVWVESKLGEGSAFSFSLPKKANPKK